MGEKELKFKILYKKNLSNSLIEKFTDFFRKSHKQPLAAKSKGVILQSEEKILFQDLVYQEPIYELTISITYENANKIGDIFKSLCTRWCDMCKVENLSHWLVPVINDYYHEKKSFHQDIETTQLEFGTILDMGYFMHHYSYSSSSKELSCSFNHQCKYFNLFIDLQHNCDIGRVQKITVKYDMISRLFITDTSKDFIELYFQLTCPPFLYRERLKKQNSQEEYFASLSEARLHEKQYERTLAIGCKCKKSVCTNTTIGRLLVMKVRFKFKYKVYRIIERLMHRCSSDTKFCYGYLQRATPSMYSKNAEKVFFPDKQSEKSLARNEAKMFSCLYAWQLVFSHSLELRDQIDLQYTFPSDLRIDHWGILRHSLIRFAKKNSDALCNALYHISEMLCRNDIFTFGIALEFLFDHYCNFKMFIELPDGMCYIRRLIITPSRMVLLPPTESFDNRVIREFPEAQEFMLRVSIQDDDFSKLTFAVQFHSKKKSLMENIVGGVLLQGISIGNRTYEVLASSSSQLREHGLWCYAKDSTGRTAEDIRCWMGDFSKIRNVAKYMARMGQCFSSSDEAFQIEISDHNELCIPDKKTENEMYVFSDGIGKLSTKLAEKLRCAKEHDRSEYPSDILPAYKPSAFQIRYKGCKGMLAEDPTLKEELLAYRPSMEKFICDSSNKLEVVKISAPRPLYLNRPLITILEQLGVQPNVFMDLQREMILDLTDSLIYEDKAVDMLEHHLSLDIPFKSLRDSGVSLTEEPFFRSLLLAVYQYSVDKLKTKARIAVPPKYGRNVLGVLDETGTLKYGQVFVQYSEEIGIKVSKLHIMKGIIVVTKNPCMHPGDVRKLLAVDVPALHHHKDVIVFPAEGHRPHPDEMAGSDLDGDEYVVIQMPELIFPAKNSQAMDYPSSEEKKLFRPIKVNDMVDFLCEFIQNDNIGTLAYAHLAWADLHRDGIFSNQCMELARKYPYVLDFAKTGCNEQLLREERPLVYPDFMEKGSRSNSYRSKRVLGSLYRFVKSLEACINKVDLTKYKVQSDALFLYPGRERYFLPAQKHRDEYISRISAMLLKYKVNSEAEALSGYLSRPVHSHMKQQELDNAALVLKSFLKGTMRKYRYIFLNELENESVRENLSPAEKKRRTYQKASAWYSVTYQCSDATVLSFAWIVSDILAEIHRKNQADHQIPYTNSSLLLSLDYSLLQSLSIRIDCPCNVIFPNVIAQWMFSNRRYCSQCYDHFVQDFQQQSEQRCCSFTENGCRCDTGCSPMKLILAFLKFYISAVVSSGTCNESSHCQGFSVQSAALQAYINLAVTHSNRSLCLQFEEKILPINENSNEEGDPIRIKVTIDLRHLIEIHLPEVRSYLLSETSVKDIQLHVESQRDDHNLLINSTGTRWQRWNLEEMAMKPNFPEIVRENISCSPDKPNCSDYYLRKDSGDSIF